MKKDIEIPTSVHVFVAAVKEWNDDFQENSWYAYLINNNDEPLEMAIVVSKAYGMMNGEMRKTGMFRHVFKEVPAKGHIKIELLENNVLELNNEFSVTYFLNNQLFDKTFVFTTNSINDKALSDIPTMNNRGVLVK
ncbi:MAG TPA: hypothetical protein VLY87_02875 [Flavobacterium sp.]|nr:hypothetical protein [Flavobacterium sp.]